MKIAKKNQSFKFDFSTASYQYEGKTYDDDLFRVNGYTVSAPDDSYDESIPIGTLFAPNVLYDAIDIINEKHPDIMGSEAWYNAENKRIRDEERKAEEEFDKRWDNGEHGDYQKEVEDVFYKKYRDTESIYSQFMDQMETFSYEVLPIKVNPFSMKCNWDGDYAEMEEEYKDDVKATFTVNVITCFGHSVTVKVSKSDCAFDPEDSVQSYMESYVESLNESDYNGSTKKKVGKNMDGIPTWNKIEKRCPNGYHKDPKTGNCVDANGNTYNGGHGQQEQPKQENKKNPFGDVEVVNRGTLNDRIKTVGDHYEMKARAGGTFWVDGKRNKNGKVDLYQIVNGKKEYIDEYDDFGKAYDQAEVIAVWQQLKEKRKGKKSVNKSDVKKFRADSPPKKIVVKDASGEVITMEFDRMDSTSLHTDTAYYFEENPINPYNPDIELEIEVRNAIDDIVYYGTWEVKRYDKDEYMIDTLKGDNFGYSIYDVISAFKEFISGIVVYPERKITESTKKSRLIRSKVRKVNIVSDKDLKGSWCYAYALDNPEQIHVAYFDDEDSARNSIAYNKDRFGFITDPLVYESMDVLRDHISQNGWKYTRSTEKSYTPNYVDFRSMVGKMRNTRDNSKIFKE